MLVLSTDRELELDDTVKSQKAEGLLRLMEMNLRVPEFAILSEQEFMFYKSTGHLSDRLVIGLKSFIDGVRRLGQLPVFALRCEATSRSLNIRPPKTCLNIGLSCVRDEALITGGGVLLNREKLLKLEPARVIDAGQFESKHATLDVLLNAVEVIYRRLIGLGNTGLSNSLIIQRMVFGNADAHSGNGICCNYPDTHQGDRYFRGIFLPGQQGIGLKPGSWGETQVDIKELAISNPARHGAIFEAFKMAEARFGQNPYFEFTIEADQLYFLQHENRMRFVSADWAGS